MAKANTYEMSKMSRYLFKDGCAICGKKSEYRGFYYPTYMNGDGEWLGDYCEEHKNTSLPKVQSGEIKLLYKVEGQTN